jgi:hypothetical protein
MVVKEEYSTGHDKNRGSYFTLVAANLLPGSSMFLMMDTAIFEGDPTLKGG